MSFNKYIWIVSIIINVCIWSTSYAQDIEDYKGSLAMAKNRGVEKCTIESIPYQDLRDAAERKQEEVTRWCKTEYRSCSDIKTKGVFAAINGIPLDIQKLKANLDQLRNQQPTASDSEIKFLENQIYEKEKSLDFNKKSLETDLSDIETRIYNGKNCVQARTDVQDLFRRADGRAQAAGRADSALQPITDELRAIWNRCDQSHTPEIQNALDAVTFCQQCKSGAQ